MLNLIARKIFGTRNDRVLRAIDPLVRSVNELEARMQALDDSALKDHTRILRAKLADGSTLDEILPEAFAVTREASRRVLGMRHFDVQLVGGAVLHQGKISEMKTGEGKTLVATLPAYLNALNGRGVHIVTVNDYLARRDSEWMGQIYRFLGLSVGVVLPGMAEQEKRAAYGADITYGQNNEFGFDYLRDNMKFAATDLVQRGHHFAIVDEVDSILIDEARTPLIISGPAGDSTELYYSVNAIIPRLIKGEHFEIDARSKQPTLTEAGIAKCEELLKVQNLYDPNNIDLVHHVNQALRAHTTMQRDVDYVVKDGQIIIVDEFTGRLMPGRAWSNGLHQAIEAKEGLKIRRENQTLASITFQNYFRLYEKLSGMTGTADTEAAEFKKIYNLEVILVPPNRPMVRDDQSDRVFRTRKEKMDAVVNDIEEVHAKGQPILVGTISIEQSEYLSQLLKNKNITHNVLNAKQHEREAEIIAQAGRKGAVTIATNMAGRGTDIVLGGNPEGLSFLETGTRDRSNPAYQECFARFKPLCEAEHQQVRECGGLFVMGTERHESRRIDNQLRGRSGRQGDPGISRFYVSLEDDLMMRFGGEKMRQLMKKMGWEEGLALDGRMITRAIERAQQRVEGMHFEMRKHVLEYDDVMNKQRQVIYNLRHRILLNEDLRNEIFSMIDDLVEAAVNAVCGDSKRPLEWDLEQLEQRFTFLFNSEFKIASDIQLDQQVLFDTLRKAAKAGYEDRIIRLQERLRELEEICNRDFGSMRVRIAGFEDKPFTIATVEQDTLLETLDHLWNQHLHEMDQLREGIDLRGYGQKNPLHEYQKEGFLLFQQLIFSVKETVIRKLFFYAVPEPRELIRHLEEEAKRRAELQKQMQVTHQNVLPDSGNGQKPGKEPDSVRAKIEAQREARRRMKR
ncbi:MAG: preprotein translocase subunit SecA [Bdellovibrionota bacterium]|nr:MAG: preprotein translocase subunit SecA [Bdellovibrionota bacterium]